MTFNTRRFALTAAGALLASSVLAACAGQSTALTPTAPSAGGPAARKDHVRGPNAKSIEYYTGITANSNPRGIANGPKGMWFTQPGSNQIGLISPKGVVTEFSAPATGVNNIVEGPDGALWFTQTSSDTIGRMTTSGKIKIFKVGNEAYGPWDITVGSDNNIWFSFRSPSTNAIGRLSTQGVTLFTSGLSPGDVAIHDIAEGPDGNVWFTEEFGNRIGKITTSGTITEYSSGITQNAGLVDITAGPDGNVWFTENSADQIGRITTSGTVTEFSQGISPAAGPGSITSADGSLWFTELNFSNLGEVSTSGTITENPISAQLGSDVAFQPSTGALWITDYAGNGIVAYKP